MEHRLIQGGEQFLPFARSRIRALKAIGLAYASQSFEIDGVSVKVRIEPGHEYITLSGESVPFGWGMIPLSGPTPDDVNGTAPMGYVRETTPPGEPAESSPKQIPITDEMWNDEDVPVASNRVYVTSKLKVKEESRLYSGVRLWSDGEKESMVLGDGYAVYRQRRIEFDGATGVLGGAVARAGALKWLIVAVPAGDRTEFFAISAAEVLKSKSGGQDVQADKVLIGESPEVEGGMAWRFSPDGLKAIALESKTLEPSMASPDGSGALIESEFLEYADDAKTSITGVQHIHRAMFTGVPDAEPGESPFTVSLSKETRENAVLKMVPTKTFVMGQAVKDYSESPYYCSSVGYAAVFSVRDGPNPIASITPSAFGQSGVIASLFSRFPDGATMTNAPAGPTAPAVTITGDRALMNSMYFDYPNGFTVPNEVDADPSTETPENGYGSPVYRDRSAAEEIASDDGPVCRYEFRLTPPGTEDGYAGYLFSRGFVKSLRYASAVNFVTKYKPVWYEEGADETYHQWYEDEPYLEWAGFTYAYAKPAVHYATLVTPWATVAGTPDAPADVSTEVVAMLHMMDSYPGTDPSPLEARKQLADDYASLMVRGPAGLVSPIDATDATPSSIGDMDVTFGLGNVYSMSHTTDRDFSTPEPTSPEEWVDRFEAPSEGSYLPQVPKVSWPTENVRTSYYIEFRGIVVTYKFPYFDKRTVDWSTKTTLHYDGARILAIGYAANGQESILEVKGRIADKVTYLSTAKTYESDPEQTEGTTSVEMNHEYTMDGSCGYDLVLGDKVLKSHVVQVSASRTAPLGWAGAERAPAIESSEVAAEYFSVEDFDLFAGLVLTQEFSRTYAQSFGQSADDGIATDAGEVTMIYSAGAGTELYRTEPRVATIDAFGASLDNSVMSRVLALNTDRYGQNRPLRAKELPPVSGVQYLSSDSVEISASQFDVQTGGALPGSLRGWYGEGGQPLRLAHGGWQIHETSAYRIGPQYDEVSFPAISNSGYDYPITRRLFALSPTQWLVHVSQYESPDKGVFHDGSSLLGKFGYVDAAGAKFDSVSFIA